MAESNKYSFDEFTVEKCFNCFFIVPDYQREYVWEYDKQVRQLLDDVTEAFEHNKDKEYFIGTTVVFNNKGQNELIDGQQRTTTLFLILCAIRSLYAEHGLSHRAIDKLICDFRTEDDGSESETYHLVLQYEESSNILQMLAENAQIDADSLSDSNKRLYEAYHGIVDYLRDYAGEDIENLKNFYVYFSRNLKFIQISTPEINDALKIFETINDRGVGLNPMDLLKNLIFRQVPRDKFSQVKDRWKSLIHTLEENGEKPLRFLRYFIISNYPKADQGTKGTGKNIVREDEIYSWLVENADTCNYEKKPLEFVDLLIENANAFVNFANGLDLYGKPNVYIDNITRLGGTVFRQHIIPLLTARHFPSEMLSYLAKNIENYLFVYLLTKEQAKTFEKTFAEWNLSLVNVTTMAELETFVQKYILPEIAKKRHEFNDAFHRLGEYDIQRYRLCYLLARLTQYVDLSRKGKFVLESVDPYIAKGVEIEHILPRTPYSDEIASQFEDYDRSKSMLGNLTLIEKSSNAFISNKPYADKVEAYGISPYYLTRSLKQVDELGTNTAINRINKFLTSFPEWDQESIEARQHMLYNLALEIWKVCKANGDEFETSLEDEPVELTADVQFSQFKCLINKEIIRYKKNSLLSCITLWLKNRKDVTTQQLLEYWSPVLDKFPGAIIDGPTSGKSASKYLRPAPTADGFVFVRSGQYWNQENRFDVLRDILTAEPFNFTIETIE